MDFRKDARLAVHTWLHSWNHYGMFGLSEDHSTIYSAQQEGYVPISCKKMFLIAVSNYNSLEYVMAVKIMLKAEKKWADWQVKEDIGIFIGYEEDDSDES